ncbi:MAG: copper ion binding protein [Oscillospiraceae bacterium]|jgi:copper chaperone|nr:copper ion binding protein [Oscillospiraceae bacterium]
MEKSILQVDGMSCQHCVTAITKALEAMPGVSSVSVALSAKTVAVEYDPLLAALEKIKGGIEEQGYDIIG